LPSHDKHLHGAEDGEAFCDIEVYMVIEVESAVKVETQVSPDGFGGDDKASYQ